MFAPRLLIPEFVAGGYMRVFSPQFVPRSGMVFHVAPRSTVYALFRYVLPIDALRIILNKRKTSRFCDSAHGGGVASSFSFFVLFYFLFRGFDLQWQEGTGERVGT